jgi:mono/diheme cytochrome c family protein
MRLARLCLAALATALATSAPAAGDAQRGRVLYEAGCLGCHAESVHGRERRVAADFEAVRAWVRRWGGNLGLKWTDDEVTDVAVYLNQRHYRFACPPAYCKATGSLGRGGLSLALDVRDR